jgi:dTDP-4-dehydrorhamnose reductase
MKVLITGGSSLLGKSLIETGSGHTIHSTWYTNYPNHPSYQMDICDQSQVRYVFSQAKPDVVIHCAANGNVDFAEENYREAYRTNVDGTANILRAASDCRARVVYISTNAVYNGDNPPYAETGPFNPVNAYGKIKRQAELRVEDYPRGWLIIRPFLLYGWHYPGGRTNWAVIIKNKLQQNQPLKLVDDTIWQPTYAPDCASAIWKILEHKHRVDEIFNVATDDKVTLYEFGQQVARTWGLDGSLLGPVLSSHFETIASRPKDTSYDLGRLHGLGTRLLSIEQGLEEMKNSG